MKRKEYIERVDKLGFMVEHCRDSDNIIVRDRFDNRMLIQIANDFKDLIFMDRSGLVHLMKYDPQVLQVRELCRISMEFASTPIEERDERKKYYVKLNAEFPFYGENYLNYKINEKFYFIGNRNENDHYKTKFTKQELEAMDLKGYELVEVEE